MVNVTIKTSERTIQEQITEWKELKDLLLKYENYVSVYLNNNTERTANEERHTR